MLASDWSTYCRYALDVNGKSSRSTQMRLHSRSVVPFQLDKEAIKETAVEEGWTEKDLNNLQTLTDLIDECGVHGASKQQIRALALAGVKVLPLETLLQFALTHYLVLEVGS